MTSKFRYRYRLKFWYQNISSIDFFFFFNVIISCDALSKLWWCTSEVLPPCAAAEKAASMVTSGSKWYTIPWGASKSVCSTTRHKLSLIGDRPLSKKTLLFVSPFSLSELTVGWVHVYKCYVWTVLWERGSSVCV